MKIKGRMKHDLDVHNGVYSKGELVEAEDVILGSCKAVPVASRVYEKNDFRYFTSYGSAKSFSQKHTDIVRI